MLQSISSVGHASFAQIHFSQKCSQRGGDQAANEQDDENIQIGEHCGLNLNLPENSGGGAFAGFDRISAMRDKSLRDGV
jgi:hypothetical protein